MKSDNLLHKQGVVDSQMKTTVTGHKMWISTPLAKAKIGPHADSKNIFTDVLNNNNKDNNPTL